MFNIHKTSKMCNVCQRKTHMAKIQQCSQQSRYIYLFLVYLDNYPPMVEIESGSVMNSVQWLLVKPCAHTVQFYN